MQQRIRQSIASGFERLAQADEPSVPKTQQGFMGVFRILMQKPYPIFQ